MVGGGGDARRRRRVGRRMLAVVLGDVGVPQEVLRGLVHRAVRVVLRHAQHRFVDVQRLGECRHLFVHRRRHGVRNDLHGDHAVHHAHPNRVVGDRVGELTRRDGRQRVDRCVAAEQRRADRTQQRGLRRRERAVVAHGRRQPAHSTSPCPSASSTITTSCRWSAHRTSSSRAIRRRATARYVIVRCDRVSSHRSPAMYAKPRPTSTTVITTIEPTTSPVDTASTSRKR